MAIKIFADQCVNRDVVEALKGSERFKVVSASNVNLHDASDDEIFNYVLKNNYVLLTFDKDFGNILRFDIRNSSGVVIVYIEDMDKEEIIKNTLNFFKEFNKLQLKRRLFIIEKDIIRIWPK